MAATKTAAPGDLLSQVAGERQTGALVMGGHPGGAVYVFEGRVIYAESPAAPGVGELLTSSGRLAGRTWQNALDLGTSTARVGRLLVEQGHLTQGELELCVLGATYDAAYFALATAAGPIDFLPAATHWLGPVVHIDAAAVLREVQRRTKLLDDIFPNSRIDTAPVSPVTRPPRERVTVTALQWELMVHADGQRTPADLALLLGRAGYVTIQELRRLAALGLIELPEVRGGEAPDFVRLPQHRAEAAPLSRPVPDVVEVSAVPVISGPSPDASLPPPPGIPPPAPPPPGEGNTGPNRLPRLARRKPGAKLPKELATDNAPVHQGTDEVLLKRIRTALRALR
ncbi:DUF4388 domain-containing protein [Actinoplanes regularis]|uniref:PatA-like N-terminal domain-containing protein n=1 Tax=Actinoplanes regularis TaxID=52697 RepID=A0A239HTR6_9ACTN|nr:DUF4388 domain-containing protein [Actinoplanes regularis]GIE91089.1 hypothetical protein Are01nite_75690 [Actinoplanes regularis]SNS83614.1 hypothetical protein SAMN06264365_125103 [Actinoplanes regularis]